jgi:pimeloyl-ACP methyl ester carboxylesterase
MQNSSGATVRRPTTLSANQQNWTDIHYTARDGLRLYARHYPAPGARRRPVVCLAGLTRNCRDFHDLATVLSDARGHRRDVYCLDYRGRGRSEHDADGSSYTVMNELSDVLDFMTLTGLSDVALVGTSRGGIIAMAMATIRPNAIGAAILNDVGPVIERDGLARIVAYVGRVPLPGSWPDAAAQVKSLNQRAFPHETDATWESLARQMFNEQNGYPSPGYDNNLSKTLALSDGPTPAMWPQFAGLARIPVLALRGEHSDILSAATLIEMQRRHPNLTAVTVADQGHAPLLKDQISVGAIYEFLLTNDPILSLDSEPRTERPFRAAS